MIKLFPHGSLGGPAYLHKAAYWGYLALPSAYKLAFEATAQALATLSLHMRVLAALQGSAASATRFVEAGAAQFAFGFCTVQQGGCEINNAFATIIAQLRRERPAAAAVRKLTWRHPQVPRRKPLLCTAAVQVGDRPAAAAVQEPQPAADRRASGPPPELNNPARIGASAKASVSVQDRGGDVSVDAYMRLPVEHYAELDPGLIQGLGGNRFTLRVPRIQILGIWLEPVVEVTVRTTSSPDAVVIEATKCRLKGSDLVQRMNLDQRFALAFTTRLTWDAPATAAPPTPQLPTLARNSASAPTADGSSPSTNGSNPSAPSANAGSPSTNGSNPSTVVADTSSPIAVSADGPSVDARSPSADSPLADSMSPDSSAVQTPTPASNGAVAAGKEATNSSVDGLTRDLRAAVNKALTTGSSGGNGSAQDAGVGSNGAVSSNGASPRAQAGKRGLSWPRLGLGGGKKKEEGGQAQLPGARLHGSADLEVWSEVIPPFNLMPRDALTAAGNAVINGLVRGLLPIFMRRLAADYERWATDEAYRSRRAAV